MKPTRPYLAAWLIAWGCTASGQDIDLGPITERHEMIPMRDGNRLSAYLYFPQGSGPWPAVFEQRYADLRGAGTRKAAAKLAEAGYVVALINFRGTHLSEGTWVGYRALGWGELKDGYDTCEWLAKQPWCTGNVGTFGSSQGGYAQNFLAVTQPPHLKCQYMIDTGLSLFQEGYRLGGTTRPNRFLAMASNCRNPDDNRRLMEEWFRHPNYDDYWRDEDCSLHFDKMNVPCFTIGSWYDFMNQGSIASFIGRQHHGGPNSRGKQQLLIGPWLHGGQKSNRIGDLVYPENAIWPTADHMVRWFDHWLKGIDNGVDHEPKVRYYVMGAVAEPNAPGNAWREAADWPPPAAPASLYLQPNDGLAFHLPAAEGSSSYFSDPRHPMQIPGTSFPGAKDAREFEQQGEVLTFTTARLAEPMEWTGRVRAELYVSSTAPDTDFIVRISDVYPDGRSILICDYPWRARYREGFDHQALLEPGKVHKLEFDVGWISQIFDAGHRIRVTISSTGAPLYEPNPQTGGTQTIEFPEDALKAENAIHHNRNHASRIIAPLASTTTSEIARRTSVRYIASDVDSRLTSAVIVSDLPLIYTAQLPLLGMSYDPQRGPKSSIETLKEVLADFGSDLSHVIKLNIYVDSDLIRDYAQKALLEHFPDNCRPAVSWTVSRRLHLNHMALDAVAVAKAEPRQVNVERTGIASVMPAGRRLYISGQADQSLQIRKATEKTLQSLSATLKHCGRTDADIAFVKCFVPSSYSKATEIRDEISRYFGGDVVPVSFVEWRSLAPDIEIELIAWGGPANDDAKEILEFITPPELSKSPVFSRVASINRGGTIFIGDIASPPSGLPDQQLQSSFDVLGKLLAKTGSDFNHLAKATYYVTDEEISKAHNAIRTRLYDPARPPAASKAMVGATAHPGSRYVMDVIAVPSSRGTPATGPEHGFGLNANEAAAGWISLFDGQTTFGWKDASIEDGALRGGTTTTTFGKCELRGQVTGEGTISVGGQEISVSGGKSLSLDFTSGRGPISLGPGVAIKSLVVRPLDMKPLFSGRDMSGWKTILRSGPTSDPSPFWRVENGALRAVGGPGAIEYDGQMYGDCVLQIDVRSQAVHSNGGLFFRSVPGQFMNGYEAQLHNKCIDGDPARPSRYCTGGIDDRQDARRLVSRDFEPYRMTVVATGPHIATWVNGYQVTDWIDERPPHDNPRQGQRLAAGTIQLQAHDPATDYEVRQILAAVW